MSNVDLAAEFTNLIVAERGFQANSPRDHDRRPDAPGPRQPEAVTGLCLDRFRPHRGANGPNTGCFGSSPPARPCRYPRQQLVQGRTDDHRDAAQRAGVRAEPRSHRTDRGDARHCRSTSSAVPNYVVVESVDEIIARVRESRARRSSRCPTSSTNARPALPICASCPAASRRHGGGRGRSRSNAEERRRRAARRS